MSFESFAKAYQEYVSAVIDYVDGKNVWKDPQISFSIGQDIASYTRMSFTRHQIVMANAIMIQASFERCQAERDRDQDEYISEFLEEIKFENDGIQAFSSVVDRERRHIEESYPPKADLSRFGRFFDESTVK